MDQAKRRATKIRPNAVGGDIFGSLSKFDSCRPEVAGDVICSVDLDSVGVDVPAKFGDCRSNHSQISDWQ